MNQSRKIQDINIVDQFCRPLNIDGDSRFGTDSKLMFNSDGRSAIVH